MNSPPRSNQLATRFVVIAASAGALAGIAYLDRHSGPEIGISLLYLLPVVGAALIGDRFSGPVVAVMAAAAWLLADLGYGPTYSTRFAPVWNSFTRLVYFMGSVLLVREYRAKREAERALQRLNSELERRVQERTTELLSLNRELESFNQTIAHDLRTPLRGVAGFSEVLLQEYGDRLDDQGKQYLHRVTAGASQMGELIDALLSLSQLSRSELLPTTVDISAIAKEVTDELAQREPARRVRFNISPDLNAQGDYVLLRSVLTNLLDNAWKFSRDTAEVEISVGCEAKSGETAFFVRDNGAGYDSAYSSLLFSPFRHLHKPGEYEGHGIGLAIVASVVRLHGGSVWATSELGRGATFWFTLGMTTRDSAEPCNQPKSPSYSG